MNMEDNIFILVEDSPKIARSLISIWLKYFWLGSRNLQNSVKLKAMEELTDEIFITKGEDVDTERCTKYNRHLPKVLKLIFVKWQSLAFG